MILRLTGILLLVLILAVRVVAAQSDPDFRLAGRIGPALSAQDMELVPELRGSGAISFRHPDCEIPSVALPFAISLDVAPLAQYFDLSRRLQRTVVYLDRRWDGQEKIAMLSMLARQRLLFSLGLSPLYPSKEAILLMTDPACPAAQAVDLTGAWDVTSARQARR